MQKRPILCAAVLAALLIWILYGLTGLSAFPEWKGGKAPVLLSGTFRKAEEKSNSIYLFLSNVQIRGEKESSSAFPKVLLTMEKEAFASLQLLPGNEITVRAEHTGFREARNEGNFDEASFYRSLGVAEKFEAKGKAEITKNGILPVHAAMQWVRQRLISAIRFATGGEDGHAGILTAIVTGDKTGLDAETKDLYRKSGIAHILAISGLHISLIGMGLFSLLRRQLSISAASIASGLVMVCFCILSGESASAVRATIMFLLRLLALRLGKSFDLLSALGVAALLLLLHNPLLLFYSGFQLSFGAICGIGLFAPALESLLPHLEELIAKPEEKDPRLFGRKGRRNRDELLRGLRASFAASLSVTLFTLPVIINTYYEIPLFAVVLNLIVVPLMGLVLGSGLISALAGVLSLFLGRLLIGAGVYLVSLIEFLCDLMNRIPFSIVITGHMEPVQVDLFYGLLSLLIPFSFLDRRLRFAEKDSRLKKRRRRNALRAAVLLLLFFSLSLTVFTGRTVRNLKITAFDADQGECILLESPAGGAILIDGGSTSVEEVYRYRLESALKYRGISEIESVVITHPDTDHLSAVLEMLKDTGAGSIRIGRILTPELSGNEKYEALKEAAAGAGVVFETLKAGMTLKDGAISLSCIHPYPDFAAEDANAYSAVLELTYGSFRALFTGDLGSEEEKMLLQKGLPEDCSLLKVAHHGSKNSSCEAFLKKASPELALVSAGVNNSYGHPHPDTVKRLKDAGAAVYVTAECGAVTVTATETGKMSVQTVLPRG